MDGVHRECRQAHGDVFGAAVRRAVANPLARRRDDGLSGVDVDHTVLVSTRTVPFSTTVISSNCGRCPGSFHPGGETMRATLTAEWPELTRPVYSSIRFGGVPAA